MKIILAGIIGSQAYGLAKENSDIDKAGIFVSPTEDILSLNKPAESLVTNNPDITYHEIEKFMRLAMKGNPTILELLFLPDYIILTNEGKTLIDIRKYFLNKIIFKSYGGYAISQIKILEKCGKFTQKNNKIEKHTRHCFRLLFQGKELLETGNLTIKVKNKEELLGIANLPIKEIVGKFEKEFESFNNIKSSLPEKPDYKIINDVLLQIRKNN